MTEEKLQQLLIKFKKIKKAWLITFNLLYIGAYLAYAIYSFFIEDSTAPWMPYVLISIAVIYLISFLFIITIKNERTAKVILKNYKSVVKMLKQGLKLFNLVLSIIMITNTVMYDKNMFAFVLTIVNCVLIGLQTIITFYKFIKRNMHRKRKEGKRALKKQLITDLLSIILAIDEDDDIDEKEEETSSKHDIFASEKNNQNPDNLAVLPVNNEIISENQQETNDKPIALEKQNKFDITLKNVKSVAKESLVNALVNRDKIASRYKEYKQDKVQYMSKRELKKLKEKEENKN